MARARLIKPGFFSNETIAALPFDTRLLYVGLWTLADREGRLEDRPVRIRVQLFPYDDELNIEMMLGALAESGFIQRYTVAGVPYIAIPKFLLHQHPHVREADSTIPGPSLGDAEHQPRQCSAPCEASPRLPVPDPESVPDPVIDTETATGTVGVLQGGGGAFRNPDGILLEIARDTVAHLGKTASEQEYHDHFHFIARTKFKGKITRAAFQQAVHRALLERRSV